MPDLTRLLALDATLKAAITRIEPPHHSQTPRHLVEAPHAVATALARFLVWRTYLRSRRPTHASAMHAGHHLRGALLWRMALLAQAQGRTPLRPIPAFALRSPTLVTRAADDTPDGSGDVSDSADATGDPITWWDENAGDVYGPEFEYDTDLYDGVRTQLTPAEKAALLNDVGAMLDFDSWLNDSFLTDLQVLQLLDQYWNGKTITAAGQGFLDSAGIAGSFDIVDENMLQFLRRNAGQFVTRIDEHTKQNLADLLWKGLGGDGGPPLSMDALARFLQNNLGGKLAGLSDQRARMIAITETARAESFGNFVAMLQSGVQYKQWNITVGACRICETNQQQGAVPILEPFPSGDMTPPGHPICRCSATAALGDGTFDPNQWSYAPSNLQLDTLLSNPSFGLWPREVVDLGAPYINLAPDPQQVNMVQWGDLPQSVRDVLQPAVLDKIKDTLGAATDVDDFLAKLEALKGATALPTDITATPPTTAPTTPATIDQTQLLSADEILQNLIDNPPDSTIQETTQEATDDFMAQFKSIMGDLKQFMEGDDGERAAVAELIGVQLADVQRNWGDAWEHQPRINGKFGATDHAYTSQVALGQRMTHNGFDYSKASLDEIHAHLQTIYPRITWDLHGVDVVAARRAVPELLRLGVRYPEVLARINYVGTGHYDSKTWPTAYAVNVGDRAQDAIQLNPLQWASAATLQANLNNDAALGWMVDGPATIEKVITHEFGHSVQRAMAFSKSAFVPAVRRTGFGLVRDLEARWMRHYGPQLAQGALSQYARTDEQEGFAELFAAVRHGTAAVRATTLVQSFGKMLDLTFHGERHPLTSFNSLPREADQLALYKRYEGILQSLGLPDVP